jgi:N-acetylglucosamine-6-phosphate deacetylase
VLGSRPGRLSGVTLLTGGRVVTPDGVLDPGWVRLRAGRIADVGTGVGPGVGTGVGTGVAAGVGTAVDDGKDVMDLRGRWVLPGFVDLHVHGGGGASHQDGAVGEVTRVVELHRRHGTTAMLASLVTAPLDAMARSTAALAELVDNGLVAGVHLEGPFLAAARCGAHDPTLLRPPSREALTRLLAAGRGTVRMVTLAPELDGGLDAVRQLVDAGVLAAVGHTNATWWQTRLALDAGASVATHLFNGMRRLHHREPGPALALLEEPRVTVELINDGVHVHPALLISVLRWLGGARCALITDAMAAAGDGDGDYTLGGLAVRVRSGVARLADGSSVAGSTLTMDAALRNAVRAGVPMPVAAAAAATTPARVLGLDRELGAVVPGLSADLVILEDDLTVHAVLHRGSWVPR